MANISLHLDIETLEVINQTIDNKGNIILEVVSKGTESTCHKCGKPATKRNGYSTPIMVQHTKILERKVYLKIKPVRYQCQHCDDYPTTTEQYDWCERNAKVTKKLEEYLMRFLSIVRLRTLLVKRGSVIKQYRQPLDKLRIKEMKRLKSELSEEDYSKLNNMMWILRKKHECLTDADKESLELLYQYSPTLKQAHQFALKLTHIFNTHSNRKLAIAKIDRWISKVEKSGLTIFDTFIKTLNKYKGQIANYFKARKKIRFY